MMLTAFIQLIKEKEGMNGVLCVLKEKEGRKGGLCVMKE